MKIIFLDFNGVLDTWENIDEIDPNNLNRLKLIVNDTNAKVVISSSLKNSFFELGYYSNKLKQILKALEDKGIEVIGITPKANNKFEEIRLYLENDNISSFCILDDEMSEYSSYLKDNLINIPPQSSVNPYGLTDEHVNMAISTLNKEKVKKLSHINKNN